MIHLSATALRPLLHETLLGAGTADAAAHDVATSLIETSLRGTDSHGIHLFPHYVRAVRGGQVAGRAIPSVAQTKPSTVIVDGHDAFGAHVGRLAVDAAIRAATHTGMASALVKHSSHFGAAAYFALPAAEADHVAFAFTNADALVRAAHSRVAALGTNPICCAAPMADDDGPLCLDMATSTASWNKMLVHKSRHGQLPPGWVADADGRPTEDPAAAVTLQPLGGYKGYGLGLMVEMLTSVLADGPLGIDQPGLYAAPIHETRDVSHFFVVLRLDAFIAPAAFRRRLSDFAVRLRALPRPEGVERGMVPGDPEKHAYAERQVVGIPITEGRFTDLLEVCPAATGARMEAS